LLKASVRNFEYDIFERNIMNTFALKAGVALSLLAAGPAQATTWEASVTGIVETEPAVCIMLAGFECPPYVYLVTEEGHRYTIDGVLEQDIGAFEGREITVNGVASIFAMDDAPIELAAESFAPGRSADILTGTVEVLFLETYPMQVSVRLHTLAGDEVEVLHFPTVDAQLEQVIAQFQGSLATVRGVFDSQGRFRLISNDLWVKGWAHTIYYIWNDGSQVSHRLDLLGGNIGMRHLGSESLDGNGSLRWFLGALPSVEERSQLDVTDFSDEVRAPRGLGNTDPYFPTP
jgi:hypothetical protein